MYWIQYEGIDERYVNRNEYIYIFFLNRNEQVNWVIALKTAGETSEGGERERNMVKPPTKTRGSLLTKFSDTSYSS